jgi:hypothetical protein
MWIGDVSRRASAFRRRRLTLGRTEDFSPIANAAATTRSSKRGARCRARPASEAGFLDVRRYIDYPVQCRPDVLRAGGPSFRDARSRNRRAYRVPSRCAAAIKTRPEMRRRLAGSRGLLPPGLGRAGVLLGALAERGAARFDAFVLRHEFFHPILFKRVLQCEMHEFRHESRLSVLLTENRARKFEDQCPALRQKAKRIAVLRRRSVEGEAQAGRCRNGRAAPAHPRL